jgi:hypothetical protein
MVRSAVSRSGSTRPRDDLGRPLPAGSPGTPASDAAALAPAAALAEATRLLTTGKPFAAHEVLEAVWKVTTGEERDLWRALAQVAVAVTHARRGNPTGARALSQRAATALARYASNPPYAVDIAGLLRWCEAAAVDPSSASVPPALTD